MDQILDFLKFMAVVIGILIIIFLVLLALPKSRLRQSILKIYSIVALISTILSVGYIISPIDAIPDFIPVAGQSDDLVAAVSALAIAVTGYVSWQKSKEKIKERRFFRIKIVLLNKSKNYKGGGKWIKLKLQLNLLGKRRVLF